jgi:hypothetical protein
VNCCSTLQESSDESDPPSPGFVQRDRQYHKGFPRGELSG